MLSQKLHRLAAAVLTTLSLTPAAADEFALGEVSEDGRARGIALLNERDLRRPDENYQTWLDLLPNGKFFDWKLLYVADEDEIEVKHGWRTLTPFGEQFNLVGPQFHSAFCEADADGDTYSNGFELGLQLCWADAQNEAEPLPEVLIRGGRVGNPNSADSTPFANYLGGEVEGDAWQEEYDLSEPLDLGVASEGGVGKGEGGDGGKGGKGKDKGKDDKGKDDKGKDDKGNNGDGSPSDGGEEGPVPGAVDGEVEKSAALPFGFLALGVLF